MAPSVISASATLPSFTSHPVAAMRLYYNPACSKCRQALALLESAGHRPSLRLYLEQPPDRAEIEALLDAFDGPPAALLRAGAGASEAAMGREQVLATLLREPERMQRPILLHGGRAVVARPPERVLDEI